jgi:hypothetical protein
MGVEDFSISIFWILPNLAKFPYGWLPLEQCHDCFTKAHVTIIP